MRRTTARILCAMLALCLLITAFAENTDVWTCPYCGYTKAVKAFCSNCGKARPVDWTCLVCGTENEGKDERCANCGYEAGSWNCGICVSLNGPDIQRCWRCGNAKGTAPTATPAPLPTPTPEPTPTPTPVPTSAPTPEFTAPPLSALSEGDYFTWGTYPQTASGTDKTPIEWLVLTVKDNRALVISRYGLDSQPYNTRHEAVTWETCTLRKWLNDTFYNTAFTDEEKLRIMRTTVYNTEAQCYSGYTTDGGNNTKDSVFLLSYDKAEKYLGVIPGNSDNVKSRVQPTEYALLKQAYTSGSYTTADGNAAGWWWLRSPGGSQSSAARVYADGSLSSRSVNNDSGCVRPALWIKFDAEPEVTETPRQAVPSVPELSEGDYFTWGTYPQTASGTDNTPIEWLVLTVKDNRALVISRYGLDSQPYNTGNEAVTWETCTLRSWLNDAFIIPRSRTRRSSA